MTELHCPQCSRLLIKDFQGDVVTAYCRHCKLETTYVDKINFDVYNIPSYRKWENKKRENPDLTNRKSKTIVKIK